MCAGNKFTRKQQLVPAGGIISPAPQNFSEGIGKMLKKIFSKKSNTAENQLYPFTFFA